MSDQGGPRFIADNARDGTPIVLDARYYPRRLVVTCSSDEQAERIAALLSREFPSLPRNCAWST